LRKSPARMSREEEATIRQTWRTPLGLGVFSSGRCEPRLSPTVNPVSSQGMHRDYHRWYSERLNRDMGVAVYGHFGMPILAFPTSGGDEWEQEGQGMIRTLAPYLDEGRIRIFSI